MWVETSAKKRAASPWIQYFHRPSLPTDFSFSHRSHIDCFICHSAQNIWNVAHVLFTDWIWFIPKRCFPILASPAPPARWLGSWRRRGCTWWWCGACPTTSTSTTPTLPSASYSSPPSSQGTCYPTGISYTLLQLMRSDQILGHQKSFATWWS